MGGLQIYFVGLPGWFAAAALYIVLSRLASAEGGADVKTAARLVSLASLVGTIVPPVLFFAGHMELDADEAVDARRHGRMVRGDAASGWIDRPAVVVAAPHSCRNTPPACKARPRSQPRQNGDVSGLCGFEG